MTEMGQQSPIGINIHMYNLLSYSLLCMYGMVFELQMLQPIVPPLPA